MKRFVAQIVGLLVLLLLTGVPTWGAALEVSQPVQVTSSSYYERGEAPIYDGSSYWLVYGRSSTVQVPYATGNPDVNDYEAYYKKAPSIVGLTTATATLISGVAHNSSVYLGETGAAYYGSDVWAFGVYDSNGSASGGTCDLYGWWTSDGGSTWNEVGAIVSSLSCGQGHHDEIAYSGELWVVEGSGNFTTTHSATPKSGGWSAPLAIGALGGGLVHFFVNGSDLYLAINASGLNYIYRYNSGGPSWALVDSNAPPNKYDPTLFKVGSKYVFAQAPWDGTKQYLLAWNGSTLDGTFFDAGHHLVTEGAYGANPWVDMWPIGFTDAASDTYLFFTSERNPSDTSAEIAGNIWYLMVDWPLDSEHYTYIQEAVDGATTGSALNIANGTYTEAVSISGKALTLTGESESGVIVQADTAQTGAANTFTISAAGKVVTLQRMTIRNGDYGIRSSAGNVNVLNCTIYHNGWDGTGVPGAPTQGNMGTFYSTYATSGGGIRIENSAGSEIGDCTIYENDRGIRFQDGANGSIHDNISHGNIQAGIYLAASSYTGVTGCSNTAVSNNESYGNMNNGLLSIGGISNTFGANNVHDNWNSGVMLWHVADNTIEDNTITGNDMYAFNGQGNSGDAYGGVYADGASNDVSATFVFKLLGNTISNNLAGAAGEARGVFLGTPLPADGIVIDKNAISGHDVGIRVERGPATITCNRIGSNATEGVTITGVNGDDVAVTTNAITGNTTNGLDVTGVSTGIVDATNDYWGCAAGPGNLGCDTITGTNLDYTPPASSEPPCVTCVGAGGDVDSDTVCGNTDNCPSVSNVAQTDTDSDGLGDACDTCPSDAANDADSDTVCGDVDNCPSDANTDQADTDSDGVGDVCDANDSPGSLVCSKAKLRIDTSIRGDNGRFRVKGAVSDYDTAGGLATALVGGSVTVQVSDGGSFDATVALTGCAVSGSGRVKCRGGNARAKFRPMRGIPLLYRARIMAKNLSGLETGTAQLLGPVTAVLTQGDVNRVDSISACKQKKNKLSCKE